MTSPQVHTLPRFESPFDGYDISSEERPTKFEALADTARDLIGRPDFRVIVYAKYNPDKVCVGIKRDNGRGITPRLEGLSVVAYHEDFRFDGVEAVVKRIAAYLATAEVQPVEEACALPYVRYSDLPAEEN